MFIRKATFLAALAALAIFNFRAAAQGPDPLGSKLFPPDFVLSNADTIGLKPDQREAITALVKDAQGRFAELQRQHQLELEATAKLAEKPDADRAAVLAQFDKMSDREKDIRRAQFAMLLDLRKNLTEEQSTKLAEIRAKATPPASLREKVERVKAAAAKAQGEGRDMTPVGQIMQQFDPLMRAGKFQEAEALLDQLLKVLAGGK